MSRIEKAVELSAAGEMVHFEIQAGKKDGSLFWVDFSMHPIMDADGNVYTAVRIGTQEWLVENLKTTKYVDGTPISLVTDSTAWNTLSTPAYCWLNNDSAMYADKFGALYNYYVVADSSSKKVCPSGWQIPTHNDFEILKDYMRYHGHFAIEGKALKAVTDWILVPPYTGTDDYRFKALPAAFRNVSGTFGTVGYEIWFRSNTEYNDSTAITWQLYYESYAFNTFWSDKRFGFSVRCLRD